MFTGIVEEVGIVKGLQKSGPSARLTVGAKVVLENACPGDSIAVNGVCLTVTELNPTCFTADVMHETLRRSSLGDLRAGSPVNLERAMAADGRFGGHMVSGHIDGTGTLTGVREDGNARWYTVSAPSQILRYIIEKGSVAIDGISLTVAEVDDTSFQVSVIPHTAQRTTLSVRRTGDQVNLENDCVGKYVEKLLTGCSVRQREITEDVLLQHGF